MAGRFYIDGDVIPSIVEKPVKSLGRWYSVTLSGRRQVSECREFIVNMSDIDAIDTLARRIRKGPHCFTAWPKNILFIL